MAKRHKDIMKKTAKAEKIDDTVSAGQLHALFKTRYKSQLIDELPSTSSLSSFNYSSRESIGGNGIPKVSHIDAQRGAQGFDKRPRKRKHAFPKMPSLPSIPNSAVPVTAPRAPSREPRQSKTHQVVLDPNVLSRPVTTESVRIKVPLPIQILTERELIRRGQSHQNGRDSFGKASTGRLPRANIEEEEREDPGQDLAVFLIGQKVARSVEPPILVEEDQASEVLYEEDETSSLGLSSEFSSSVSRRSTKRKSSGQVRFIRVNPTYLDPMYVDDQHQSDEEPPQKIVQKSVPQEDDAGKFENVNDIESVMSKYASILDARTRILHGDDIPAPPVISEELFFKPKPKHLEFKTNVISHSTSFALPSNATKVPHSVSFMAPKKDDTSSISISVSDDSKQIDDAASQQPTESSRPEVSVPTDPSIDLSVFEKAEDHPDHPEQLTISYSPFQGDEDSNPVVDLVMSDSDSDDELIAPQFIQITLTLDPSSDEDLSHPNIQVLEDRPESKVTFTPETVQQDIVKQASPTAKPSTPRSAGTTSRSEKVASAHGSSDLTDPSPNYRSLATSAETGETGGMDSRITTAESKVSETMEPLVPGDDEIEEPMHVQSVKLSLDFKKPKVQVTLPSRSKSTEPVREMFPFARFATPEPRMADYSHELRQMEQESPSVTHEIYKTGKDRLAQPKKKHLPITFKEVLDAELSLQTPLADAQEPMSVLGGAKMNLDEAEVGRGAAILGMSWSLAPTTMAFPALLRRSKRSQTAQFVAIQEPVVPETPKKVHSEPIVQEPLALIEPQVSYQVSFEPSHTKLNQSVIEEEEDEGLGIDSAVNEWVSPRVLMTHGSIPGQESFPNEEIKTSPEAFSVVPSPQPPAINVTEETIQVKVKPTEPKLKRVMIINKKKSKTVNMEVKRNIIKTKIAKRMNQDPIPKRTASPKHVSIVPEELKGKLIMIPSQPGPMSTNLTAPVTPRIQSRAQSIDESNFRPSITAESVPALTNNPSVLELNAPYPRPESVSRRPSSDMSDERRGSEMVTPMPGRTSRMGSRSENDHSRTSRIRKKVEKPYEDPTAFYTKLRRRSTLIKTGELALVERLNPNIEKVGSMSARPVIGVVSSAGANEPDEHPESAPTESAVTEELDSQGLANRRLIHQALVANGFTKGSPNNLFEVVHKFERRKVGLSPIERAKYPTFEDLGPALDATGTPIIQNDNHTELRVIPTNEFLAEIDRLDGIIDSAPMPVPANLRRRGILLAATGTFMQAMDDLNAAIQYDPYNSDAFWQRSQLHLRLNDAEAALRDLDALHEFNKVHLGAFQAKARIYQALGILKLAIVNYSAVIRLKPENADAFYNRACLFEAENEMVYANEDFRMVRQVDPTNEHAIYNLATYNFQKQLWEDAILAFSKLIQLNPENAQALSYRGRAYASVARFDEALDDLSNAIRILPNRSTFFFHRGCLLRERNPQRAITDLSISVLIDDSVNNCNAFYHRAQLYHKLGEHELAISDYINVIDLDPGKAKAYLNLGILQMQFFGEYEKALVYLNKAILHDPIHLRSYLCRAELYQLFHKQYLAEVAKSAGGSRRTRAGRDVTMTQFVEKAIKDYSRAIHISPNNYLLYLYRGRLLLKQNMMKEATFDFHAAFDLNASIAQTFIQRALVLSFQRKYKQIIEEFEDRRRLQALDDPALLLLVAKARIRCGDFKGALDDLSGAVEAHRNDPQIFLQRGICYEHLRDWASASAEFSKCLVSMPTYAKAYYHRGLCKLYEGDEAGIADLDRAIEFDKHFFDAYLTRASYHHAQGFYTKAIDDCNEALKLEPTSIRSHLLRGACKCKLNQFTLAINDFTKAINIDRASHFAFYNRAVTYQLLHDYDAAIKDYSIVLLIHDDSNAYRNRALIYWRKGDHDNALLDLYAARDNFPQDAKLRGVLGLCLQKVGNMKESLKEFTAALDISPHMKEVLLGRGNVYASMGDIVNARRDYAKVFHMYHRCAEALVNTAYTMQTENRQRKAFDLFSLALAIDPQCTSALEGRSIVHMTMKNYFAALVDISRAIEIVPNNPEYLTNRGVIYQAIDDNVSALQNYKAALTADPSYSLSYFNAANLYLRQKLWEQAISYYDKALEYNKGDKASIMNRGICKVLLKDFDGALADFNTAQTLDPTAANVYFNRGHLMKTIGQFNEAEQDFSQVIKLIPSDHKAYLQRAQVRGQQTRWDEAMKDFTMHIITDPN